MHGPFYGYGVIRHVLYVALTYVALTHFTPGTITPHSSILPYFDDHFRIRIALHPVPWVVHPRLVIRVRLYQLQPSFLQSHPR